MLIRSFFVFSVLAFGQQDQASLLGVVEDSSGAVMAGATVQVRNRATAQTWDVTTDNSGLFIAPVLPVGIYSAAVSHAGFKTKIVENIRLQVSDRIRVTVRLEPGAVQEKITVNETQTLIDTASTTLGGTVDSRQVADLPANGRDISSLLSLIPGVMLLGGATQQSVNGTNMYRQEGGMNFMLDGGDATRVDFSTLSNTYGNNKSRLSRASMESVQEFRVQSSSFSAEFGTALGGVMNMITKSGTNALHGSLFEYFRNEKLDSRTYFNAPPQLKPPFRLNQFGSSIGGPLRRDKLFFFANYEGVQQRLGKVLNTFVPTAAFRDRLPAALRTVADMLPLPTGAASPTESRLGFYSKAASDRQNENSGAVKIDYLVSSRDRLSGRYNANQSDVSTIFGVGKGQIQPAPGLNQLAKLTYTRTISATMLNEIGLSFNRIHIDPRNGETDEIRNFPTTNMGGGTAGIGPSGFDLRVANNSYTILESLSWVRRSHQIKMGAQITANEDNKETGFQRTITFQTLDDFAANKPFSISTLGQPRVGMRNRYNNFFLQDDFQLNRRLTLNMGLRYQYDTAPSESHGRVANFNQKTGALDPAGTPLFSAPATNFAPRFGIAYSPSRAPKTVIRSGFGMFYAPLNAAMTQNMPGNVFQQASNITRQQFPDLTGFPYPPLGTLSSITTLTAFPAEYIGVYTEQWNFNIQQGIGSGMMIQAGYIGNRGMHLNGRRNINRLLPGTRIRPYANFSDIALFSNDVKSNYNAMQLSFRRSMSHGMRMNVNYTWAHSLDEGGIVFGTALQDDTNRRADYGNGDHDVRHTLQFDYSYQLPYWKKLPAWLANGWQMNGISVMRSGLPVNVTCGCDSMLIGANTARPNAVAGVSSTPANYSLPGSQLNIAAFARPANGTWGNLGRNTQRGPAAFNWDYSVFKNFRIAERRSFQFRAELFNVFNTPQFGNPGANFSAPASFGKSLGIINTSSSFGTNRQVQFALRYQF